MNACCFSCLAFFFALAIAAPSVRAQTDSTSGPPAGPLLARPADYSEWIVTFSYADDTAKRGGPVGSAPVHIPDTRSRKITTTKTRAIIHEEVIDGYGTKFDLWQSGTTLYSKSSGPYWDAFDGTLAVNSNGPHPESIPVNGFRDLDWITSENYIGTIKSSGGSYLVFSPGGKTKLSPGAQLDLVRAMPAYALIDGQTRLPVEVKINGATRVYQFTDAPSRDLTLPADLVDQLNKAKEAVTRLTQPMPRPQ